MFELGAQFYINEGISFLGTFETKLKDSPTFYLVKTFWLGFYFDAITSKNFRRQEFPALWIFQPQSGSDQDVDQAASQRAPNRGKFSLPTGDALDVIP